MTLEGVEIVTEYFYKIVENISLEMRKIRRKIQQRFFHCFQVVDCRFSKRRLNFGGSFDDPSTMYLSHNFRQIKNKKVSNLFQLT